MPAINVTCPNPACQRTLRVEDKFLGKKVKCKFCSQPLLIEVQADVSSGLVGTTVVGRADVAINEARERCRMAVVNSGLEWPTTKRITILLSPADLAKRGTHFDLAIAVAVLAAHGRIRAEALRQALFVGELTLSGGLRAVPGVLPMVLAGSRHGLRHVFDMDRRLVSEHRHAALRSGSSRSS